MTAHNPTPSASSQACAAASATEVPLPTRLVSNEEFPPLPQTRRKREVESGSRRGGRLAPRLG